MGVEWRQPVMIQIYDLPVQDPNLTVLKTIVNLLCKVGGGGESLVFAMQPMDSHCKQPGLLFALR